MAHQITSEGGANLAPAAPAQIGAEGGASLGPAAPAGIGTEGGASLAPVAPGQITAEYAGTLTTATLLAEIPGTRNNLILTAQAAGVTGNLISLEILEPVAAPQALAVTVAGTRIRVAPATAAAVAASGSVEILNIPQAGDVFVAGNISLTWVAGTPGAGQVQIAGTVAACATNLTAAITSAGGQVAVDEQDGTVIYLVAATAGSAGNLLALQESTGGERMDVSGPLLTGGSSFPSTTTGTELKAALEASAAAAALVAITYPPLNSDGTGSPGPGTIAAYPQTYLSGGAGTVPAMPAQIRAESIY